jgi:multiple sugar transport system permease protein
VTLTTQPPAAEAEAEVVLAGSAERSRWRRRPRRRQPAAEQRDRGIISPFERRRPGIRRAMTTTEILLLVVLVILGLGPLLWLAKSAITPTQDTLRQPLSLFPHGTDWAALWTAWNREHLDRYFFNTLAVAGGSWASQLLVATTAGYALSVLRPRYGKILTGLVLGTLLVPVVVLLVPLYLTVLNPPLWHHSLLNSWWAIWLPAGANPFNVVLMKRFFDNLPREVFEAARVDGAGPYRVFWSIVLPLSRPILGVVSVFAIIAAWKDYLWPFLVLTDPVKEPLSVRLPILADLIELNILLAALFISTVIPILLFLVFQRLFLNGAGLSGAVKG